MKIHNSEHIISYSAIVSASVGVFKSLNYHQDLISTTLLGQAVQKLPPNLKEAWSLHTVRRSLDRPTLIEFNDWLKQKAEAHERTKMAPNQPKSDDASSGAPINSVDREGAFTVEGYLEIEWSEIG